MRGAAGAGDNAPETPFRGSGGVLEEQIGRPVRRDDPGFICDAEVIQAFAEKMGDTRHLIALYLLTVADIRGTSPKVWNAWKAKLLDDLYHAAFARLADPTQQTPGIEGKKTEARNQLALYGLSKQAADSLWNHLDARYFARFDTRDIAWQGRMLWRRVDSVKAVVCARLSPVGAGIQVLVYAPDRPDIAPLPRPSPLPTSPPAPPGDW